MLKTLTAVNSSASFRNNLTKASRLLVSLRLEKQSECKLVSFILFKITEFAQKKSWLLTI